MIRKFTVRISCALYLLMATANLYAQQGNYPQPNSGSGGTGGTASWAWRVVDWVMAIIDPVAWIAMGLAFIWAIMGHRQGSSNEKTRWVTLCVIALSYGVWKTVVEDLISI